MYVVESDQCFHDTLMKTPHLVTDVFHIDTLIRMFK